VLPGGGVPVSDWLALSLVDVVESVVDVADVDVVESVVVLESEVVVVVSDVVVVVCDVVVVLDAVVEVDDDVGAGVDEVVLLGADDGLGLGLGLDVAEAGGPVVVCVADERTVTATEADSLPSLTVNTTRNDPDNVYRCCSAFGSVVPVTFGDPSP
jgi:hypothetical protein